MREKLNKLALLLPEGSIASIPWFKSFGYSAQLIERYKKSGRLVQLGRSAYYRLGRDPQWQDVVISLNNCWDKTVHVGAVTALELQGYGHYIRMYNENPIYLYCHNAKVLPQWIKKINTHFISIQTSLFKLTDSTFSLTEFEWPKSPWLMRISNVERAILEMLDLVPRYESFEHAKKIMTGLQTLRPDILMKLLQACSSIKVKRLFLFFAESLSLPCFEYLDLNQIDLGKGTRQIIKNGQYNSKYRITIAKDYVQ